MKRRRTGLFSYLLLVIFARESIADVSHSLVVCSSEKHTLVKRDIRSYFNLTIPEIYQMKVKSAVKNRYAYTTVTSKVRNSNTVANEAVFAVTLPETAFISSFIMEVNDKNYTAIVKEKEEARKIYNEAVSKGISAGHVEVSTRDSNFFTVSVNIEPETKTAFYLSYEELLQRQLGHYELVINLHPGQPVKDLSAEVVLMESRKIIDLQIPSIRTGNEITVDKQLDPRAQWGIVNDTMAIVLFNPDIDRQIELARLLGTPEKAGFAGQFVVEYDVERDPKGGEVLIQDGYFVHFFAPSNLRPLPKYISFVLDTSSSMAGSKIEQLKEAMLKILQELHKHDLFQIVEFNSVVKIYKLDSPSSTSLQVGDIEAVINTENEAYVQGYLANKDNIEAAKKVVANLKAEAATNIYDALKVGLLLAKTAEDRNMDDINRQPIVMFLTDGEPTDGVQNTEKIINDVTNSFNDGMSKIPIFSLSFGDGADRIFLQQLSLNNAGFSKHIYEAADASLQLQNFYKQISSPLLANVTFKYEPTVTSLTNKQFPIYFEGSELVVAGIYGPENVQPPVVDAWNGKEYVAFQPVVRRTTSSAERLWAYLTIKQLLERRKAVFDENEKTALKKKALELSLKYSFVTPVTSMVVVKLDSMHEGDFRNTRQEFGPHWPSNTGNIMGHSIVTLGVFLNIISACIS